MVTESEPEDVVAFAARLYQHMVDTTPTVGALLEAVLDGIGKEDVYPLARAEVQDGAVVAFVWRCGHVDTVPIPARLASSRSLGALRLLERLGHAVLRSDAHFPPGMVQIEPTDYRRWARGEAVPPDRWQPLPAERCARGPSSISPLLEWFDCQRRAAGAVGWYWCLPMLYLAGTRTPLRPQRLRVSCPPPVATPLRQDLCPGLPAGCAVRFRHWRVGTWRAHAPLVQHLGRTVCFSLPGLAWGDRERQCPRWREDRYFPLDPDEDDLVVCMVAGRLPLALAGFHREGLQRDGLYVTGLCALTGGRGGSLVVDWLQRRVRRGGSLTLCADPSVAGFYERHGFRPRDDGDPGTLRWTAPVKRARHNPE